MRAACSLAVMLSISCGPRASSEVPPVADPPRVDQMSRFTKQVDAFYWAHLEFRPTRGVSLGHHQYDGKLPDRSADAVAAEVARLRMARAHFAALPASELSDIARLERDVLVVEIDAELFDLDGLRSHIENPLHYVGALSLAPYVTRDYAPLDDRARAIISLANASTQYVEKADANLAAALPRTWIDNALLRLGGMVTFAKDDVIRETSALSDDALRAQLEQALSTYTAALHQFQRAMTTREADATDNFALGEAQFLRMLRDKEGVEVTLARLEEIGLEDLARNREALEQAAREIDPNRSVEKVVARVTADRPAPDEVIDVATDQAALMRQLLVDKELVTIPSDDVAEVRPSPPFMRWNSAFLSSAGPFEKRALPSFYYISPPDPSWPRREQREYIPSRGDLLFTTVHELWPGHFLHALHRKRLESKVVKSFCTYSMTEGWAHYAEELMWEHGAGDEDPRYHIGQLGDALLRNARYLSAIGLHAKGVSVEESKDMFVRKALTDARTAKQQALRGTFDPGYLNYTLGKLMIKKLREDWRRKVGSVFSLKGFHDEFLSRGCAPIPVIRAHMLGENAGSPI